MSRGDRRARRAHGVLVLKLDGVDVRLGGAQPVLHAESRANAIPHGARELAARIRGEDERRDAEERDGAVQLRDDAGRVGLGGDARAPLSARSRLNGMHEVARAIS